MSVTTVTTHPRLRDAEHMLRAICPVLREQPLYLVDHRTAPELEIPAGVVAWAGWRTPFAVQPFVPWRGPGFATVLRTESIHPDDLSALVLHELCHWLPWSHLVEAASRHEGFHETAQDAGAAARALDLVELRPERLPRPWDGHGPGFIRLYLHATWRASRAGFPVRTGAGFDWFAYRIAPLKVWRKVLGDEPRRLRALSLQDVAAGRAPAAYRQFSEQWLARAEARFTGGTDGTVRTHGESDEGARHAD